MDRVNANMWRHRYELAEMAIRNLVAILILSVSVNAFMLCYLVAKGLV